MRSKVIVCRALADFPPPTQLETPCRLWQGAITRDGYGHMTDHSVKPGRTVLVHRWVAAQIHGWDAINDKVVMHRCDQPLCYRFDHLIIGTRTDNAADMVVKRRHWAHSMTHCPRGHEFTEENTTIRGDGSRQCRICRRERDRRYDRQRRHT